MNKKFKIIISIIIVILIVVLIILNINKINQEKNEINTLSEIPPEEANQTNITWNNMDNAKIIDNEKVCTSKYLEEEHEIWYYMANTKSDLTSNNLEIYTDKENDVIIAKIPITNNGDEVYKETIVDVMFYRENKNQIFEAAYTIKEIKPKETYVLEIKTDRDITNTYDYQIWIED